jgi:hypothetical protein
METNGQAKRRRLLKKEIEHFPLHDDEGAFAERVRLNQRAGGLLKEGSQPARSGSENYHHTGSEPAYP